MGELENQKVLVTGGCENFGFELACWLAENGADVAVTGKDEKEVEQGRTAFNKRGADVTTVTGDVTELEQMKQVAERCRGELGALDVLFNNASVFTSESLDEVDPEKLAAAVRVGLLGALQATRAVLPLLRAGESESRVVNMVGWSAIPGMASSAVYSSVKGGLRTFGEGLRSELGEAPVEVTNLVLGSMASWLGRDPSAAELEEQSWPMLKISEVLDAVEFILTRPDRVTVDELRLRNVEEKL